MVFWVRHLALIVLCVCLPFGAAIYEDTRSERDRAMAVGSTAVKLAQKSLTTRLTLESHRIVGVAVGLSQELSRRQILREMERPRRPATVDVAVEGAVALLRDAAPPGGFAWLVDESGRMLLSSGRADVVASPRLITQHPIFAETQQGYALDGIWRDQEWLALVGAAPITDEGRASGAVFVGIPIDKTLVETVAASVNADLTVTSGGKLVASTLPAELSEPTAGSAADMSAPVVVGRLAEPLTHPKFSLLPLFIDHDASGYAYVSLETRAQGDRALAWVISVRSGDALRGLAQRQELILWAFLLALMVAILAGLANHRSFVRPIQAIADHLSEIQLGRGEVELPEKKVSKPFRRLVRLVNMTVQKLPARALASLGGGDGEGTGAMSLRASAREDTQDPGLARKKDSLANLLSGADSRSSGPAPGQKDAPAARSLASSSLPSTPPRATPPKPGVRSESVAWSGTGSLFGTGDLAASADLDATPQGTSSGYVPPGGSSAIADAIASLEAKAASRLSSVDLEAQTNSRRSAAAVRGKPMSGVANGASLGSSLSTSDFRPSPAEIVRAELVPGFVTSSPFSAGGARAGGSLDALPDLGAALDRAAGVASFAASSERGEETVVAPVASDLLARSAREEVTDMHAIPQLPAGPDSTVVSSVPADLLARTAEATLTGEFEETDEGLDAQDQAHFRSVYEEFVELRRRCGEATSDLGYERFLAKLKRNRSDLVQKYNCRTVRFQVYEKDGKAALKATPVRTR